MPLKAGQDLSHYRVLGQIGKGGMGEVYRATDTKLGRDVAIKVLPAEVAADPERLARFDREARLLASLNHPNVAQVYGFESAALPDGSSVHFLAMELVEGEDLAERLQRGPIPPEESLEIAAQIGAGLEEAHGKGIVHRDLKPANVKVTADGKVKVLDFGLAKAWSGGDDRISGSAPALSQSPTLAAPGTAAGLILGTAAYMSPEQARGKPVDKRADVWAFGVVLYEMLTGRSLFSGETVSDVLAAVLTREPDWTRLPPGVPGRVRRLLRRCLERDPRKRLRDIGDVLLELGDDAADDAAVSGGAGTRTPGHLWLLLPWAVALVAVVVAAALALTRGSGHGTLPLRKLTILPISDREDETSGKLSPDGRRVAYLSGSSLEVRDLDQTIPRRVADVSGFSWGTRFWSPDSRWLAFESDDKLWKAPMDGSAPIQICEIPSERRSIAGAWGRGDRIFLAQWRGGILEVSASGGTLRELMKAPEDLVDYHRLSLLPDGETLLGSAHLAGGSSRVDVIRDGKILRKIRLSDAETSSVSYAPSGHLVFGINDRGIWAVPFSLDRLDKQGEPFLIDPEGSYPSVAMDGSLVYTRNTSNDPGRLVRVGMSGKVSGTIGEPGERLEYPLVSPTGSLLAYTMDEKDSANVWTIDLESGATRRLTRMKGSERACSWSSDGKQLLVARAMPGNWSSPDNGLYLVRLGEEGEPDRVADGRTGQLLPGGAGVLYWKFGL
ncbi:MAG TPA: protein kinase, partial [Candidatus Saccharimonadales bacterium]|nr:protein kinase [Candidatus Saccharimonadales bacterium]